MLLEKRNMFLMLRLLTLQIAHKLICFQVKEVDLRLNARQLSIQAKPTAICKQITLSVLIDSSVINYTKYNICLSTLKASAHC